MTICFYNAHTFGPDGFTHAKCFVTGDQFVHPNTPERQIDCAGKYLVPGLIDLQVNGIDEIDFTTNLDLVKASEHLARRGTTSFLATIVSLPIERYSQILDSYKRSDHANCLGLHFEGPHINPKWHGAHDVESIAKSFQSEFWKSVADSGAVKMVTLAPELAGTGELLRLLHERGILIACGHTEAGVEQLEEACRKGLSGATHLFNAMKGFHQRDPGVIGYVLGKRTLWYSLIVDGEHLHPATVAMAFNAHPQGLVLVSDLAGRSLAGKKRAHSLTGSSHPLLDGVNLIQKQTTCSLHQAILAASTRPAELLGLAHRKGRVDPGYEADFLLLQSDGTLHSTYVAGKQVFGYT